MSEQTQPTGNTNSEAVEVIETDTGAIELSPNIIYNLLSNGNKNITYPEAYLFLQLCKAQRLNPYINEAYLVKYGDSPAQLIVSKDVIFKRATSHEDFEGMQSGLILLDKESKEVIRRENGFYLKDREEIVGAWAVVHRKGRKFPSGVDVNFDEFAGRKNNGSLNSNWAKRPSLMIIKVAESHAFRKAFPKELQGCYEESEMSIETTQELNKLHQQSPESPKNEVEDLRQEFVKEVESETDGNAIFA